MLAITARESRRGVQLIVCELSWSRMNCNRLIKEVALKMNKLGQGDVAFWGEWDCGNSTVYCLHNKGKH